jgi:hypothetical protein
MVVDRLKQCTARKRPLPCMRWKGPLMSHVSDSPIARPANPRNTPPSVAEPRRTPVDSVPCLPERRLPEAARQLGKPCREPRPRSLALANSRLWDSLTLEDVLRAGSPSLVACKISSATEAPAQEAGGTCFKIFWDGSNHPQNSLGYPQAGACCPPVIHWFIHTLRYRAVPAVARVRRSVSTANATASRRPKHPRCAVRPEEIRA